MRSINIYRTVKLHKHEAGTYSYTDTYGELHEFASANEVWEHLTEDGEEFGEEVEAFVFGDKERETT